MYVLGFSGAYLCPHFKLTRKPARKSCIHNIPKCASTNLRFTPESGEEVRQCGEQVRQHLVFGLKVEYALSSEVFTRFLGRF
jgi:hypothetical protein